MLERTGEEDGDEEEDVEKKNRECEWWDVVKKRV